MPAPGGLRHGNRPNRKVTHQQAIDALLEHGSIRSAAKALGVSRASIQNQIDAAKAQGKLPARVERNPSRWRPGDEIIKARKAEFQRVFASRPGIAGNVIMRPDDLPFCLLVFGDEHLDNPGTDLELFEHWASYLDRARHITGVSMGDVIDNWKRVLSHLYAQAETTAPESWILFEHYMELHGEDFDASVGGNHDDWSGASDVLGRVMEEHGVLHRSKSLRWAYRCPGGRDIYLTARHSWPGRSLYNEVHGLKRAARFGIRDNILLGGHIHTSGETKEKDPVSGKLTFCYQVASFKLVDDYADDLGLMDRNTSPAIALVIDPRRADTDPELVKHFHEPEAGADYLAFLRRRAK